MEEELRLMKWIKRFICGIRGHRILWNQTVTWDEGEFPVVQVRDFRVDGECGRCGLKEHFGIKIGLQNGCPTLSFNLVYTEAPA